MGNTTKSLEARVKQFIRNGQSDKAASLLFKLALERAHQQDFKRSEAYRDQLYEVDSMALPLIVKVNEVIEAQKSKVLTPDFRHQWAPFFKKLSREEANAFFFSLIKQTVPSEQVIIQQGRPNDKLYLIHQGRLKIIYVDQDKDLLIDTLSSGDIIGHDSFFSVNVSTVTVKTLTPVQLSYLDRSTLEQLRSKSGFSEDSLKRACRFAQTMPDRLRKKGLDRRSHKRFNLNVKISFQLLSSDHRHSLRQAITAELWDISKSGLCFYFHSKNREAVRRLIGRTIGVRFNVQINGRLKNVTATGVVHGVASHPLDEYSIHLKLNRHFSDAAIQAIQKSAFQNKSAFALDVAKM